MKDGFLTNFENITGQAPALYIVETSIISFPIKAFQQGNQRTMDPAPQPTNADTQQATNSSNATPSTLPPKPITVAAPKAAPRSMGQIFTVSGILEGDEGTEFSPDENREVAEQQVKNVLEEVAVRLTSSVFFKFFFGWGIKVLRS
ncbi:hypothetical protein NA56DRAFT_227563 [Hyaloscypha hepaticicola]|uniref:Uncharacterized protein n=1 Tax=Hyaloscypha hepaticicola TaxID=2082293 RepID=A0A2J6QLN4_9HELO|nr:hypothetical protein NA56DRAFT_227563 [Hyaloscypha hepaticicola]